MQLKVFTHTQASRMSNDQRDFFFLTGTPNEEQCTQAGQSMALMVMEATAYIHQLVRLNGQPPEGAEFFILENHHEFGAYWEAGIWFVPTKPDEEEQSASEEYAIRMETGPEKWDQEAIAELRAASHPKYAQALYFMYGHLKKVK